jgi:hypothetical protein
MITRKVELRVFRGAATGFSTVQHSGVLLYWPHGFGDFVFLSTIVPLLEPTNRYFITRFGDDNSAVFDGCDFVTPLYLGFDSAVCGHGKKFNVEHFGLEGIQNATTSELSLPLALAEACKKHQIDCIVHLPFWETYGRDSFPFHTKGRKNLRLLVSPQALTDVDLSKPLLSALNFTAPAFVQQWVENRLRTFTGWMSQKLCLITRNGYTSVGKNWGHLWRGDLPAGKQREGEECRDFMRLLHQHDPGWIFVVMEDRIFKGDDTVTDRQWRSFSYAELFTGANGGPLPFALVLKALLAVSDLTIGVPSGPTHLAMAKPGLPTIGIWTEHFPSWYDEPKNEAIHLLSRNVWAEPLATRPGSFSNLESLNYRMRKLEARIISGEDVFCAFEDLMGR